MTPTTAMRQALEALTMAREQLAGDRIELIACHAWPAGSGVIPEHDRSGTQALREYDECLTAADASIAALRAALADASAQQPPAAQQGGAVADMFHLMDLADEYARLYANANVERLYGTSQSYTAQCTKQANAAYAALLKALEARTKPSPPARQALTTDQIDEMDWGSPCVDMTWGMRVAAVRAVERAHGIGIEAGKEQSNG